MDEIRNILERMYSVTNITHALLGADGTVICTYPTEDFGIVQNTAGTEVIEAFRAESGGTGQPLILFFEPGFLLGIICLEDGRFILTGPASPFRHTRTEVLRGVSNAIRPEHLQRFCDRILQQPLMPMEKMKDLICLLTRLLGNETPYAAILFSDRAADKKLDASDLNRQIFEQREFTEYHVPQNFEQAICAAVEAGDRAMLERALFAPHTGQVGRMSANELRQQKYAFICLATLISRAAIRGGLDQETAFSLSDLYCQRADLLTDIRLIENLTFTMLVDFCGKVRENNRRPAVTPVIENCLDYISVHLHEPIRLEALSRHCGLCGRSLSIRFREEVGMPIPDYVHSEKMREARYLLRHTDYSLPEIASCLNYPSQSYFTQIFKKHFAMTPLQYRESRKNKE